MELLNPSDDIITREFRLRRSDTFVQTYKYSFRKSLLRPAVWKLEAYLQDVFYNGCRTRPKSASDAPRNPAAWYIPPNKDHLVELAAASGYAGRGKYQHRAWQLFMLNHDPFTIAAEIPVWSDRVDGYRGFIDLIRVAKMDSGRYAIQILDLKPDAAGEDKPQVFGQLAAYREALLDRLRPFRDYNTTGDIESVDCIFLDDTDAFAMSF